MNDINIIFSFNFRRQKNNMSPENRLTVDAAIDRESLLIESKLKESLSKDVLYSCFNLGDETFVHYKYNDIKKTIELYDINYRPKCDSLPWYFIYEDLLEKLFELQQLAPSSVGSKLFKLLNDVLTNTTKYSFIKEYELNTFDKICDPFHFLSALCDSKLGKREQTNRIKDFCKELNVFSHFSSIDFTGCLKFNITKTSLPRENDQNKAIWELFVDIKLRKRDALISFEDVKSLRGIQIPSFTMFLYLIDSNEFLPLDSRTQTLSENLKGMVSFPDTFEQYLNMFKRSQYIKDFVSVAYNHIDIEITYIEKISHQIFVQKIDENVSSNKIVDPKPKKKKRKPLIDNSPEEFIPSFNEHSAVPHTEISNTTGRFELVAIKTYDSPRNKSLANDELFKFSQSFEFEDNRVLRKDINCRQLWSDENKINVSAILGANGSGKSTLIDYLHIIINNVASRVYSKNIELEWVYGCKVDLYIETDTLYRLSLKERDISVFSYSFNKKKKCYGFPVEVELTEYMLKSLFFNMTVNYSLHSLNCSTDRSWLDKLFHRTDGYKTPIVLEPLRTKGNIDINLQNRLAKLRLVAHLLDEEAESYNSRLKLTQYQEATHISLKLNKKFFEQYVIEKGKKLAPEYDSLKLQFEKILEQLFIKKGIKVTPTLDLNSCDLVATAKKYLFHKLIQIGVKNPEQYKAIIDIKQLDSRNISILADKLLNDRSHVTYKVIQTLNFIKHFVQMPYKSQTDTFTKYSVRELAHNISSLKNNTDKVIEFLPPPFFDVEIILENDVEFEQLSSGEKQKIFSIYSIVYHVSNLNSISPENLSYRNMNIVLDEVELYFHPELQRAFIADLLKVIKEIDTDRILNINFLFITHSPFLLSDIPSQNILFLERSTKVKNSKSIQVQPSFKTLGGNIHELLLTGFFMEGSIGKNTESLIDRLLSEQRNLASQTSSLSKEEQFNDFKEREQLYIALIENFSEGYLKNVLLDSFWDIKRQLNADNQVETKIKKLEREIAELKTKETLSNAAS